MREQIANQFQLTSDDRSELLPSGRQPKYANRLGWAKTYLEKAGLIRTLRRGVYELTPAGKNVLNQRPAKIDISFLSQFPDFVEFRARTLEGSDDAERPPPPATVSTTPLETFDSAYEQLRSSLKSELLAAMMRASPAFFERLVVDLLVKMGYGGSLQDAGRAVGRSGDGGIDGIIKQDMLGLDVVYVQAKRWQNVVGRPEVQAFAGSLDGVRARKGVFITTSSFSGEARAYVGAIEKKIVLIDGDELASHMIDRGVGVTLIDTYELKRVDADYFSEDSD